MHQIVFYIVTVWLALLFGFVAIRTITIKSSMNRIQTINTLTLPLIALLALFALNEGKSYALDGALILSLLSFVGTIAAAIYQGKWRYF